MTSPGARQRRRRQQTYQQPRDRREVTTAVLASVAVVGGTVFAIWMLRPGGLADRQPRISWVIGLALLLAVALVGYVTRPRTRLKLDRRIAIGGGAAIIAVLALVVCVTWPKGIIRHTKTFPTFNTNPPQTTTTVAGATTTTAAGATTSAPKATVAPGATTTTGAGATTTKPASTTTPTT